MMMMGKDEGDGEDGKSNGDGAKRAVVRKMAMSSNSNNEMMATETTTQHCCHHHCYPHLSRCSNSFCFGALATAGTGWWWRMRTMVGARGRRGGVVCGVLVHRKTRYKKMFLHLVPVVGVQYFPPKGTSLKVH